MKRPRVPIAGLMAAVAAVAVNLSVMRSFATTPNSLPHFFFACGVLPIASILILVALFSAPNLLRGGWLSPFVIGFEASGWAAVFAFITYCSIATSAVIGHAGAIAAPIRPFISPYVDHSPSLAAACVELGFATILFSLPQLLLALLGGWLARKSGLTVRFEHRRN
ncbi:MAG: hypothetical protein ACHRXM_03685 [Isosphaerales bacterium]